MGISGYQRKIQPYNCIAFRVFLALVWTQYTVLALIKAVIARLPYIGALSEIFIPVCMILSAIVAIPWFTRRVNGKDFVFYISIVLLVLLTMVFFPRTYPFLSENWLQILLPAGVFYFVGVSFSFSRCSRDLFYCSLISMVCVFAFRLYQIKNGAVLEHDDMDTAYKLLPSAMYLVYYASYKKRFVYWAIAISMLPVMLVFGTRGPVLCMLAFIMAIVAKKAFTTPGYKKVLLLTILFAAVIVFILNNEIFESVLRVISKFFGRIGFSSRIFDFYLSGDFTESQGRHNLAKQALEAIIVKPGIGYGFTADRYLFGVYPHNFILEIWCHFGVIFGSLVLLGLFFITLVAHLRTLRIPKVFNFLLMLAIMVFGKLLVSNSYTIEPYFYFLIGVYVSVIRKTRN